MSSVSAQLRGGGGGAGGAAGAGGAGGRGGVRQPGGAGGAGRSATGRKRRRWMMRNTETYTAYSEADAARYAGWYQAEFTGTEPLQCEMCGSIEDVSHTGPGGDEALCIDCAASA